MTISFDSWLGDTGKLAGLPTANESRRAVQAHRRVMDNPTSIAFRKTDGTTLSAQNLRVEFDSRASVVVSPAGTAPERDGVIFGWRNHPTLNDSDIQEGYRFVLNNDMYRITDTLRLLGEIQAEFVASG